MSGELVHSDVRRTLESRFDLRDRVTIDGDAEGKGVIGIVTALAFRVAAEPSVEVSWFYEGQARTAWIDAWRLALVRTR